MFTDFSSEETLIPSCDDLANPSLVSEGLLALVFSRPELLIGLLHDSSGVNSDCISLLNLSSAAFFSYLVGGFEAFNTLSLIHSGFKINYILFG